MWNNVKWDSHGKCTKCRLHNWRFFQRSLLGKDKWLCQCVLNVVWRWLLLLNCCRFTPNGLSQEIWTPTYKNLRHFCLGYISRVTAIPGNRPGAIRDREHLIPDMLQMLFEYRDYVHRKCPTSFFPALSIISLLKIFQLSFSYQILMAHIVQSSFISCIPCCC